MTTTEFQSFVDLVMDTCGFVASPWHRDPDPLCEVAGEALRCAFEERADDLEDFVKGAKPHFKIWHRERDRDCARDDLPWILERIAEDREANSKAGGAAIVALAALALIRRAARDGLPDNVPAPELEFTFSYEDEHGEEVVEDLGDVEHPSHVLRRVAELYDSPLKSLALDAAKGFLPTNYEAAKRLYEALREIKEDTEGCLGVTVRQRPELEITSRTKKKGRWRYHVTEANGQELLIPQREFEALVTWCRDKLTPDKDRLKSLKDRLSKAGLSRDLEYIDIRGL